MPIRLRRLLRFPNLFSGTPARRRRRPAAAAPAAAEVLEQRRMLSAVKVTLTHGTLVIRGTGGDDKVEITADGDTVTVDAGGELRTIDRSEVSRIWFRGLAGHDDFDNSSDVRSVAWGGAGDDSLSGGSRRDLLFGGRGDDTLVGGAGRDLLVGGRGDDVESQGGSPAFGVKSAPAVVTAVTSELRYGILVVRGTMGADDIRLTLSGGRVTVHGGALRNYDLKLIKQIVVDAASGNDKVDVAEAIKKPTFIYGGYGRDRLYGGGGADQIYGGGDGDVINGRAGADLLVGGRGTDAIAGGPGRDDVHEGLLVRKASMSTIESEIVGLVNQERARRGLRALVANSSLSYAADQQSAQMVRLSELIGNAAAHSHALWGVRMPTPQSRIDYAGFGHSAYAENLAFGYTSAVAAVTGWMSSQGHAANILSPDLTHIGVAVRANADGTLFFTQAFARKG